MVQFWNYLHAQPLTGGVLAKLDTEALPYISEVDALTSRYVIEEFDDERKQLDFVFRTIQHCAMQPLDGQLGPEIAIGQAISNESKYDDALNAFREFFLEPFYEFLDDALDQQATVLSLLIKYKRKVEWFERDELVTMAAEDERRLAKHL
jgi:hypothetical protein